MFLASKLGPNPFARILWQIHAWGLATAYASGLLLLIRTERVSALLAPVRAVGRMALTNYLLQALLIVPVCIGLKLFDRVTPGIALLLSLVVWSIQVPLSIMWLKYFQFGPVEWLWRSITYGRLQPMRVGSKYKRETLWVDHSLRTLGVSAERLEPGEMLSARPNCQGLAPFGVDPGKRPIG
jgi:uncharacterized membrane protein YeiB